MKKLKENLFAWMYFLCIFIILIGFAYTTLLFNRAINQVSKNYLLDNNRQLASHISYRLKAGKEFISDFADTLGRMPAFLQTENLLERKAHALGLEGIAVFSPKGVTLSSGEIPSQTAWATRHPQIWDRPEVSYIKDVCLIFSAPIVDEDSSKQILVGIQSYQETQSLVSRVYGQHNGVSILFDAGIKAPIMMEKGAETTLTDAEISDILGSLTQTEETLVTTRNGINVSVKPITATDWVQVSIMPANILVDEMNEYITIYLFLIIAGFLFLIVATYRFKKSALKKEQYFLHDPLTTGYNREGFLKESSRLLDGKKLSSYSVVCMNTSNFRYINETWGEDCGNQTLRFIYRILAANLADSELVCRSHVDHFLIMLHKRDEAAVSAWTAESIAQINNMIFKSFGVYSLNFTVGSCNLDVAGNLNSAIDNASYAAKYAKEQNICSFYSTEMAKKIAAEYELNELFEDSLKRRCLKVYLQPKVSPMKGVPCQAEALVRWEHPEKGRILPDQFIPLLEKSGKICDLDLYMFEEVCRLVVGWLHTGKPVPHISVNLSRYHLKNAGAEIWKNYREIKERYGIPDSLIEIELTETMLLDQTQLPFVKQVLHDFRSCGFLVALDDFGFAYSSLALLKEFEIDTLKLDRSFFLNETEKSREIVKNTIQLAHSLGMCVVAEGIETEDQVSALCTYNCDLIQGYFYSPPLSVEDFDKWRERYEK